MVKTDKSKILGLKHINITIQIDLWGNEVVFRERDNNNIQIPKTRNIEVYNA